MARPDPPAPAPSLPHVSPARLARLKRNFELLARISPRVAARAFLSRFAHPGPRRRLDAEDEATLARARRSRLPVGTGEIEVYEWGEGAGPRVLVMHGWGSHAPRFSAFVEAFLARSWRVLAFDAPGHGRSTGEGSSLLQFRAALDAVVAAHGPVEAYLAHSLGALALALRLGDPQVRDAARAAVLVSMPRDASWLMEAYLDAIGASAHVRELVRRGFRKRYGVDISALSGLERAHAIGCEVMVVHDEEDESVPAGHGRELHERLGGRGVLRLTRGLGHNRLLRDAATVEAVAAFLAARLPPGAATGAARSPA